MRRARSRSHSQRSILTSSFFLANTSLLPPSLSLVVFTTFAKIHQESTVINYVRQLKCGIKTSWIVRWPAFNTSTVFNNCSRLADSLSYEPTWTGGRVRTGGLRWRENGGTGRVTSWRLGLAVVVVVGAWHVGLACFCLSNSPTGSLLCKHNLFTCRYRHVLLLDLRRLQR